MSTQFRNLRSGLLDQFYQDPYTNVAETESLISQIVTALHKIKDAFIILTSRMIDNQIEFPAMSRIEIRTKQIFDETKLSLSITIMVDWGKFLSWRQS